MSWRPVFLLCASSLDLDNMETFKFGEGIHKKKKTYLNGGVRPLPIKFGGCTEFVLATFKLFFVLLAFYEKVPPKCP